MKKADVRIGGKYAAKVSGKVVPVTIVGDCLYGGWYARNERTGRRVRIKSPRKLRYPWIEEAK